jgi:hypothetical protein
VELLQPKKKIKPTNKIARQNGNKLMATEPAALYPMTVMADCDGLAAFRKQIIWCPVVQEEVEN